MDLQPHDDFALIEVGAYEATTIVAGGGNHDTQSNTAHLDSPSLNDVDIQYHADIVDEQAADDCWSPASSGCADVVVAFDSPATTTTTKTKTARSHLPVEMDAMLETKALRNIKCQQCRRYFCTDAQLQAHQLVRHSAELNDRFRCDTCQQSFSSQGSLYKHQKIHTGERPFVCDTCGRSFNQLANLQRHHMVHTGEKPFACKLCGKQFSQQSNVDKHQVTHSKIKPFACPLCPKKFTQRANMQKHERVHTGDRPFVCPICRKGYAQHANMKKHMKLHDRPSASMAYLCAKCKNLYDTVSLYEAHLDTCEGVDQDNSELCDDADEHILPTENPTKTNDSTTLDLNVKDENVDDDLMLSNLMQLPDGAEQHLVDVDDPLIIMHDVEYLDE